MFFTDVTSIHLIRDANLLVASQARQHPRVVRRSSGPNAGQRLIQRARSLGNRFRPDRDHGAATFGPLSASLELFRGLSTEQLAELGRFVTVIDVPSGHALGRQGEPGRNFVTVLDGRIGVTIDGIPHAVLDDGTHFGAIPLLDAPISMNRATFTTMAPSKIAVACPREFSAILDLFPIIAHRVSAMARVRREYLVDLARSEPADSFVQATSNLLDYPAHLLV